MRSKLLLALALLIVAGCGATNPQPIEPEQVLSPPVGEVALIKTDVAPDEDRQLEIGIVVFSVPGPVAGRSLPGESIYLEIAQKESQYLPYVLRNVLMESNQWGAVRVLPEADPSVDLNVQGTIISSSGLQLQLHITATDSTGRQWLDKTYRDLSSNEDYPGRDPFLRGFAGEEESQQTADDPFADLYHQIANDLLTLRDSLQPDTLNNIRLVSQMRYAADLSSETFGRMLERNEEGLLQVRNLPARDDPMLERVETIRQRHHLFIDTVDEYYESLYQEMQPSYALWRRYSRDEALEDRAERERAETRGDPESGSFLALSQSYNRYKWAKLFEQEFTALARGFNNEVAPAILELNRRVHGLSGNLEEQYRQWREILRQIYVLETGDSATDN